MGFTSVRSRVKRLKDEEAIVEAERCATDPARKIQPAGNSIVGSLRKGVEKSK